MTWGVSVQHVKRISRPREALRFVVVRVLISALRCPSHQHAFHPENVHRLSPTAEFAGALLPELAYNHGACAGTQKAIGAGTLFKGLVQMRCKNQARKKLAFFVRVLTALK